MVEIHSNFTVDGSTTVQDGVLPTNHAEHETLEITQGINDWSEVGFYVFSSIQPGKFALSSTRKSTAGILLSTLRSNARYTAPA